MRKGDIYRWHYTVKFKESKPLTDLYWCKSQIAVVQENGDLNDTYWADSYDRFGYDSNAFIVPQNENTELTFIANFDELENTNPSDVNNYAREDIVNLRHANNSNKLNFFIRKGARPSKEIIEDNIRRSLDRIDGKVKWLLSERKQILDLMVNLDNMTDKELSQIYFPNLD